MEKYYIAQLEAAGSNHDSAAAVVSRKLVGLQYARKPPTFGALYLVESRVLPGTVAAHDEDSDEDNDDEDYDEADEHYDGGDGHSGDSRRGHDVGATNSRYPLTDANQSLKLAALNINSDNSAKFIISHEINLAEATSQQEKELQQQQQQQQQQQVKVVDFNTLNDQLLLEISHLNTTIEQRLQSSCFILNQRGDLFVISLIEPPAASAAARTKLLLKCTELGNSSGTGSKSSLSRSHERFIEFKLFKRPVEEEEEDDDDDDDDDNGDGDYYKAETNAGVNYSHGQRISDSGDRVADQNRSYSTLCVHILSDKCYYYCLIIVKNTKLDCDIKLVSKYSLQTAALGNKTDHGHQHPHSYQRNQSTLAASSANLSLKFVQLLPIESRKHKSVVLLKLSDGSERIVKQSKCLHSTPGPSGASSLVNECLAVSSSSPDQPTILLSYSGHKLTANSLLISHHDTSNKTGGGGGLRRAKDDFGEQEEEAEAERGMYASSKGGSGSNRGADPDGLLPPEPSFELEQCWLIDLSEIDGIRSAMLQLEDDNDNDNGHDDCHNDGYGDDDHGDHDDARLHSLNANARRRRLARAHGCLCPMWLGDWASNGDPDDLFGNRSSHCWPNYLLLAYSHHVLVYCFEQLNVMPFSIVYDRAFLELDSHSGDKLQSSKGNQHHHHHQQQQQQKQLRQQADKCVDLRIKPKLLHNFKLIGSAPSDSLFNVLFLTQRMHLHQVKCYNQLGLLVGLSQLNHVLVFKLVSSSVVKHKDNLYQQSLLGSIRASSLLSDEIQRIQAINLSLRHKLASLESDSSTTSATATTRASTATTATMMSLMLSNKVDPEQVVQNGNSGGNNLEQLITMSLRPHELLGGLYNIQLEWPSSIGLKRLIVISTVNSRILAPISCGQQLAPSIRSFKVNNFDDYEQDEEGEASGGKSGPNHSASSRALFLTLEQEEPDTTLSGSKADQGEEDTSLARHTLRHLNCSATKAWAILELNTTRLVNGGGGGLNMGFSGQNCPFASTAITVPVLMTDGQFGGKLSVYFVFKSAALAASMAGHQQESHSQHRRQGDMGQTFDMVHMQLHNREPFDMMARYGNKQSNRTSGHAATATGAARHLLLNKFHRQQVEIKPLQSYRASRHLADATMSGRDGRLLNPPASMGGSGGDDCVCRLEIDGTFSDEQIFTWLNECLDISVRTNLQSQIQARVTRGGGGGGGGAKDIKLKFSSQFTHCFIEIQIGSDSNRNEWAVSTQSTSDEFAAAIAASLQRQRPSKLTIISDDFIALNLIEKHVFTEATNESIKLVKTDRNSPAKVDNLRHLIGKQKINIDLYMSHFSASSSASSSTGSGHFFETGIAQVASNSANKQRQVELVLESLLSETDLQDMPIMPELKLSTNWLERSLRHDLDQVVHSQYEYQSPSTYHANSSATLNGTFSGTVDAIMKGNSSEKSSRKAPPPSSQFATLIDMVCGYIIDALVDYDNMHSIKSTTATMIAMRSRLIKIIWDTNDTLVNNNNPTANFKRRLDTISSQKKFANQVLDEWAEVKKNKQAKQLEMIKYFNK